MIGKPFKPGESGNPSGRPKSGFSFKKELEAKLNEPKPKDYLGRTYGRVIIDKMVHKAAGGSLKAATEILDRLYGRPAQTVLNANLELNREIRAAQLKELLDSFPELPGAPEQQTDEHSATDTNSKPN